MKAYIIDNPEVLKQVVPLMKWQREKDKVAAFARVWSATERKEPDKVKKASARIEISKSAQVFKIIGEEVTLLGTMNLKSAKEFTEGMKAV